ncbi:MAG: hypothetical protein JNM10_10960 [Planctomycetia bacterium]|nr:hypothetical protein [Planctomycetia bacterium]
MSGAGAFARRWVLAGALMTVGATDGVAVARDAPPKPQRPSSVAPVASTVVVRRQTSLEDAFRSSMGRAEGLSESSGVLVVADPTDGLRAAVPAISAALAALSATPARPKVWQTAVLGRAPSAPVDDPAALGPKLGAALATAKRPTLGPDTLGALRTSIGRAKGAGGLVIYLAHARFEDAVDLEGFVEELRKARRTLCVIGPEAAFERAWKDVLPTTQELLDNPGRRTFPDVGTNPFPPEDPKAPWRGGDTAYPPIPYLFSVTSRWDTAFGPPGGPDVAVPSAFGPYGLMRACGLTGGAYVLWGWTAGTGTAFRFDYGRCNLFPPDLRARTEILDDVRRRPLAFALLRAWDALALAGIVDHTAPIQGTVGRPMAEVPGLRFWLSGVFDSARDRDDSVASARASLGELDGVLIALGEALRAAGDPKDDVDRRYRADADLLQQALEAIRFRTHEYILWSSSLQAKAWRVKRSKSPYVEDELWIEGGDDDDPARVRPRQGVVVQSPADAERLLASRRAFLERYRGTPFGAVVARNDVYTWKIDTIDLTLTGPVGGGRSPSGRGASDGPAAPPAGSGSTGTPGPTTGK